MISYLAHQRLLCDHRSLASKPAVKAQLKRRRDATLQDKVTKGLRIKPPDNKRAYSTRR